MAETSLMDIFPGDILRLTVAPGGISTDIYVNKKTGVWSIITEKHRLIYDPKRFREGQVDYAIEELNAHEAYEADTIKVLKGAYLDLNDALNAASDLEKTLGFITRNRPSFILGKLYLELSAMLRQKTLRGQLDEDIYIKRTDSFGYKFIEAIVNYGEKLLKDRLEGSPGELTDMVRATFGEWLNVQGNLSYLYSRLVATADKRAQAALKVYNLLCPDSDEGKGVKGG